MLENHPNPQQDNNSMEAENHPESQSGELTIEGARLYLNRVLEGSDEFILADPETLKKSIALLLQNQYQENAARVKTRLSTAIQLQRIIKQNGYDFLPVFRSRDDQDSEGNFICAMISVPGYEGDRVEIIKQKYVRKGILRRKVEALEESEIIYENAKVIKHLGVIWLCKSDAVSFSKAYGEHYKSPSGLTKTNWVIECFGKEAYEQLENLAYEIAPNFQGINIEVILTKDSD